MEHPTRRHGPHHGHAHGLSSFEALAGTFALGALLNLVFIGVEVVFGIASNSVALLADAGHNFGDVLGLLVAWGGAALQHRRPSARFTYGFGGSSILAALFNAIVLLITVGGIAVTALQHLAEPAPVAGTTVMVVAAVGIVVNGLTALLFRRGGERDLNVRAVFLHMLGDAVVSVAVVLAGAGVALSGRSWIDPALSLIVAVFLVASTWRLLRRSLAMALAAVPHDLDLADVKGFLAERAGVAAVHDLHIWPMSTTERALTCHLVVPDGHPGDAALSALARELNERFAIGHATIQIESGDPAHPCELVPDHVV
ncbi:MAG TPA: cation diffusion facilitator family transporter [Alphaproteobacteria bacterium]|nr:cation diffusion facilitator family transporter [Alphaproteobacteria bacterium]